MSEEPADESARPVVPSAPIAPPTPPPFSKLVFTLCVGFGLVATPFVLGAGFAMGGSAPLPFLLLLGGFATFVIVLITPPIHRGAGCAGFVVGLAAGLTAFITWLMNTSFTKGRVLRIEGGSSERARIVPREGWAEERGFALAELTGKERAVVAQVWRTLASMEHASVPAFGKLGERLVALGAPAELVERAYGAALDEIRHAKRCLAIASALAGETLGPDALEALRGERARMKRSVAETLEDLARSSLEDGALAEGIAAKVAATCAERAAPELRETFLEIARDEAAHAALGRHVIDFCLASGERDALLRELDAKLRALEARDPGTSVLALVHAPYLEAYGVLAPDTLRQIRAGVLADLRAWLTSKRVEQERREALGHGLV